MNVYLGTVDGDEYGYRQPCPVHATVELTVVAGRHDTVEHYAVGDVLRLSVTYRVVSPHAVTIEGGPLPVEALSGVQHRKAPDATFDALAALVPWHMNDLNAGCAHQTVEWETDRYGCRVPSLTLTRPCPVTGYRYGTAWLVRSLPDEVVALAVSLGCTDPRVPA